MKILLLSHKFFPDVGGIETISELLATSFSKAGHEVHVLTWSVDHTSKVFQFPIVRNPGLRKLFREHIWADIVFENNPSLRLSWPGLLFKRPSIVVLQTWISATGKKKTLYNRIKYWWLKRTTQVVAISNAVRRQCWPDAKIIANSYNADEFKVLQGIDRKCDFVFIGRLVSDKGADMAIKALHILNTQSNNKHQFKKYTLTIIGEGPERGALEELVNKLELQNNVRFIGQIRGEELVFCLNEHRFLLVPSVWEEPFGIVALEGMACGCLPIVSDGGGLPDAVGRAGLTFVRGDVNSLVNTIQTVISNPDLENQIRRASIDHLSAYNSDVISNRYLEMIEEI